MLRIGCHLSSAKGYCSMAKDAAKIHANTFQFFSRNPRGGNAKEINPEDVALGAGTESDSHSLSCPLYSECLLCRSSSQGFCQKNYGR